MKKQYVLLAVLLLFLSIGAFQPFGCLTTISGTVTDSATSNPISGAMVTITDFDVFTSSATTNSTGEYILEDIPYGEYTVTASAVG